MPMNEIPARLVLEDGSEFEGFAFGYLKAVSGEVVFNTGMVGYPESLTDPSYAGQILALTYPLIGNYGVPGRSQSKGVEQEFESHRIHIHALVVADYSFHYHHWGAFQSLDAWLKSEQVPGIRGIDIRKLTKRLREQGSMLGKVLLDNTNVSFYDPNAENLVAKVSIREPVWYGQNGPTIVLIDCGCKSGILRGLLARGVRVFRVPWNYNFLNEAFDAVVISNGPGNPQMCQEAVTLIQEVMERGKPILGICLGNQLLALAAGAQTYKLKFGHHSQNQPCLKTESKQCVITSQNHGYAVQEDTLPEGWIPWFRNANDGTNEGIRHESKPFMSVQFHPEAAPGPNDTVGLFEHFLTFLK